MILARAEKQSPLVEKLSLCCSLLVTEEFYFENKLSTGCWVKSKFDPMNIIKVLDTGCDTVVLNFNDLQQSTTKEINDALTNIQMDRLCLEFTPNLNEPTKGPNFNQLSMIFKYFIINDPPSIETIINLKLNYMENVFIVQQQENLSSNYEKGIDIVIDVDSTTVETDESKLDFINLYLSRSKSDRPDGLISTLVTDEQNVCLGLCYSSKESLKQAILSKTGVYWSRTRGLWFKGKTSGATQKLHKIMLDCDQDCLKFVVTQLPPGFCHLETATCFGNDQGITGLYKTLVNRKQNAVDKSYTQRLFNDDSLLCSKIVEEAKELVSNVDTK